MAKSNTNTKIQDTKFVVLNRATGHNWIAGCSEALLYCSAYYKQHSSYFVFEHKPEWPENETYLPEPLKGIDVFTVYCKQRVQARSILNRPDLYNEFKENQ